MFKTPSDFSIILNCQFDTLRKLEEMTGMFPLMPNLLRDDLLNSTQVSMFMQLMSRITNSPVEIREISPELISTISDASIRIRDVRNRVFTYEQSFDGKVHFFLLANGEDLYKIRGQMTIQVELSTGFRDFKARYSIRHYAQFAFRRLGNGSCIKRFFNLGAMMRSQTIFSGVTAYLV